jgi:hypothetical protein
MKEFKFDREEQVAWRIDHWLKAAGYPFSRPTLYAEIHAGRIDARKVGVNTVILTSPIEYLRSLPRGVGPPVGTGRRVRAERAKAAEATV